jgi:hypothetical protein
VALNSYFYDSVNGDRPYSAADFATAFGMVFESGILPNDKIGNLGFDIGGLNDPTIYGGTAVIQGRFVELTGVEYLTIPLGSYSGQVVLRLDMQDERKASIVVKTNRDAIQGTTIYEYPLYDVTVSSGQLTGITDLRNQGGVIGQANILHDHSKADINFDPQYAMMYKGITSNYAANEWRNVYFENLRNRTSQMTSLSGMGIEVGSSGYYTVNVAISFGNLDSPSGYAVVRVGVNDEYYRIGAQHITSDGNLTVSGSFTIYMAAGSTVRVYTTCSTGYGVIAEEQEIRSYCIVRQMY